MKWKLVSTFARLGSLAAQSPRPTVERAPRCAGVAAFAALLLLTGGCEKIITEINRTAYFGAGGYADTTFQFSNFFTNNHTLSCWFMWQYPVGYPGLMLAENGAGTFYVGQGDWREKPPSTGTEGCKLLFQVGGSRQVYPLSLANADKKWRHLAIVRSGNTFTLYINGIALSPAVTINSNDPALPRGTNTLRFGRRTSGMLVDNKGSQLYGFLDDVGVFNRALSAAQVSALYTGKRLTGSEAGLIAAWNFDKKLPNGDPLPSVFTQYPVTFRSASPGIKPSGITIVSPDRNSSFDAKFLPLPFQQATAYLPFDPGQTWWVLWGYSTPASSHRGYANFCWDFRRPDMAEPQSCGQPVRSVANGTVLAWNDANAKLMDCDNDGQNDDNGTDGPNFMQVRHATNEVNLYLHVKTGSIGSAVNNQSPPFIVNALDQIAQVGTRCANNCHLHMGLQTGTNNSDVTVPMAFSGYYASDDKGKNWYFVPLGVPQQDQWVQGAVALPSTIVPSITLGVLKKSGSGLIDLQFNPAASAPSNIVVQRLALSTSNLSIHVAFSNLVPALARFRGGLSIPSLHINSSGAFTGLVDQAGMVRFPNAPLRVQGSWLLDVPGLGRYPQTIDEPIDPAEFELTGQLTLGRLSALPLQGRLSVGSIDGTLRGVVAPDGSATFDLEGGEFTLTSPLINGGPGDYDGDGKIDAADFNQFVSAFRGPITSNSFTSECLRYGARASARVEIDPSVARPHPGEAAWDISVLNDGITARSNWGNNSGNYDTFNGATAAETNEWLALLLGPPRYIAEDGDVAADAAAYDSKVAFNAFRYWRGPKFRAGRWWGGPVTVEVMTTGDPRNTADVLESRNWTPVARSDGTLGTMSIGPFTTTPEPNDAPRWDSSAKAHRETGDPVTGSYRFNNSGDADNERPYRPHDANDGDRELYVARPDYLHFTFPETFGAGIRIRGLSASGPLGTGTYVSCAELQAWFNPTNAPDGFCGLIGSPAGREAFDFDGDGDVDLDDYAAFLQTFTGLPQIERTERSGSMLNIRFSALANRTYHLQCRDSLSSGSWSNVTTLNSASIPAAVPTSVTIGPGSRFYRLELLP